MYFNVHKDNISCGNFDIDLEIKVPTRFDNPIYSRIQLIRPRAVNLRLQRVI